MRWRGERQSTNIEVRRGFSAGRVVAGGGLGTLLLMILALVFGVDPRQFIVQWATIRSSVELPDT